MRAATVAALYGCFSLVAPAALPQESTLGQQVRQSTIVHLMHQEAEGGDAEAQARLGYAYYAGLRVTQDYAEASKWYGLAAEQGNATAQVGLGVMYEKGEGVTQDHAEASKWYRLAAEQGDAFGQLFLGGMYRDGMGVPQDYVVAHTWLNLAAARLQGESREHAAAVRDSVASKMTAEAIREAQRLAREWRPQATPSRANQRQ